MYGHYVSTDGQRSAESCVDMSISCRMSGCSFDSASFSACCGFETGCIAEAGWASACRRSACRRAQRQWQLKNTRGSWGLTSKLKSGGLVHQKSLKICLWPRVLEKKRSVHSKFVAFVLVGHGRLAVCWGNLFGFCYQYGWWPHVFERRHVLGGTLAALCCQCWTNAVCEETSIWPPCWTVSVESNVQQAYAFVCHDVSTVFFSWSKILRLKQVELAWLRLTVTMRKARMSNIFGTCLWVLCISSLQGGVCSFLPVSLPGS